MGPASLLEVKWLRCVLYALAGLLVPLAVLLRAGAGDGQVGLCAFLLVSGLFCVFAVLPGYCLLRLCSLGRGSWIDWLGPSFVVSLMLMCVWAIPGYLLGLSLAATAVFSTSATILFLAASFFLAKKRGADRFLDEASRQAGPVIALVALMLIALAVFNSLRAPSHSSDLWFHAGGVTQMVRAGALTTVDPFHHSAEPHPMYVMNTWYVVLAVLARFSGCGAVDVVRILPAMLVPAVISCQACVLKVFIKEARERLLALGILLAFFTLFSSTMEGSSAPSMWREFTGPRWVALFGIYPVALAWACKWIQEGGWPRIFVAAAANGTAFFVHPQGGQFCGCVLFFLALAGLLWRDRQWLWRAAAALALMGIFVAPLLACRMALLGSLGGQQGGVSAVGDAGGLALSTLGGVLGSKYVSRAVELLASPLWFLGLAAVPLWWQRAREPGGARVLLFALGPALVFPLLPLVAILPVGVHPNLLFRSVWAAPALASLALAVSEGVRSSGERPRFGPGSYCWFFGSAVVLIAVHLWMPDRFEPWDGALSLLTLGFLGSVVLMLWSWHNLRGLPLRLACSVPFLLVSGYQGLYAGATQPPADTARDFAAQVNSRAIRRLAADDHRGYVASGTVLGSHLTALAGARILGAHKVAYTDYRPEHRSMQGDLVALLRSELDLSETAKILESRSVTRICIVPERCASFAQRISRLPLVFPLLEEDRGVRLHAVALSPERRREQAEDLVRRARTAEPLTAQGLWRDAELLAGKAAVPSEVRQAHAESLKDLRRRFAADLAANRLFAAAGPYLMDGEACAARGKCAGELIAAGRLVEEEIAASEMKILALPTPRDGQSDRNAAPKAFPLAISRANEPRVAIKFDRPRLLRSVRVKVRTSQAWRRAELVRLVLHGGAQPPCFLEMKPSERAGKAKTVEYSVEVPVLVAEKVEVRFFTEGGYTIGVREIGLSCLVEPTGDRQ